MTTYKLPDMPDKGPLYDKDGEEWNREPHTESGWETKGRSLGIYWTGLLRDHGPLTDVPPFPKDAKFALDKDGDVWVKRDGKWHSPFIDRDELPDNYAPYRALKFWDE